MQLGSRRSRYLFFGAVVLMATVFAGTAARIALAQAWGESSEMRSVARAIALDPDNPELHQQMGSLHSADTGGAAAALADYQRAIALNPRCARCWLAAGQACFVLGDQKCAMESFERAVKEAPARPGLEWQAASYYAAISDARGFSAHAARLLELRPDSAYQVLALAWVAGAADDSRLMDSARRSQNIRVRGAYLDVTASKGRFDLASQCWKETVPFLAAADRQEVLLAVRHYLQRLLNARHYGEAVSVWQDLLRMQVVQNATGDAQAGNLVFNGNFATPVVNTGFDWQIPEQRYVSVDLVDQGSGRNGYSGRVLRVEFTTLHNADYEPVFQFIPLESGKEYSLTALVRSEDITSDSGPRLRVQDAECRSCLDVVSEATVGSTDWHETGIRFATGSGTRLVRLSVWRPRGRAFPMEISGRFWLHSVSLKPADQQPQS